MNDRLLVPFPGSGRTSPFEVGGKGFSLIRLADAGLPVPPGAILTSAFFASWYDEIRTLPAWAELVQASPGDRASLCAGLKARVATLQLTAAQREVLDGLRRDLAASGDDPRVAVRSSSPDEDLASASFAGLYETSLGVRPEDLEAAVRACFASSLDARVLAYRLERGLGIEAPGFAAVVQRQVDSEVAGVGFSLNPVTNDYDEAVVEASWGLGTSVVDGRVSPDRFVVDKVGGKVVESTRGAKQLSIRLDPRGGTVERRDERSSELALTEDQLRELAGVLGRIEALYGAPVDVEWAYAGGELHLLQARPMTVYVPLPPELTTRPGERRRLYADAALSKGLTSNRPISPLGLDAVERSFTWILERWIGSIEPAGGPDEALNVFAGGRMYMNLSLLLRFVSPRMMARSSAPTDRLMAATLGSVDAMRYKALRTPRWVGIRLLGLVPRVLWRMRGLLWNAMRAFIGPDRFHRELRQRIERLERDLRDVDQRLSLEDFRSRCDLLLGRELDVLMAALLAAMVAPDRVVRRKSARSRSLADRLTRGAPGNVVLEMGMAMHCLATLLGRSRLDDLPGLVEGLERRRLPREILSAWDEFVERFGCRGPLEMDLASPRYGDDPRIALRQMSSMLAGDGFDPSAAHRRHAEERHLAYEELMRTSSRWRRPLLRRVFRIHELFAGHRDTPKHLNVLANHALRRRALNEGRRLAGEGRLDHPEEVFDLRFEDLRAADEDPALDLRAIREERIRFHAELAAHVTAFPAVIDSRGRVLRPPPREEAPGLLAGTPVSPGVARGPVNLLRAPDEKPVLEGDVLVAYTTDPGWTPLFVGAAAVVLEVGGVLQHGAVVAREYGKPCVVGIDRVVERLRDGDLVEVDGAAGTVRLLSKATRSRAQSPPAGGS